MRRNPWRKVDDLYDDDRAKFQQTGIPRGFPPVFESIADYVERVKEVRDELLASYEKPTGHFVYIVETVNPENRDPIKIGYSTSPNLRFSAIQSSSPRRLKLAGHFACPTASYDKRIHRLLPDSAHSHGEWYRPTDWVQWVLAALGMVDLAPGTYPTPVELLRYRDPRTGGSPADLRLIDELVA